ncbi:MAG TPA: maltose alpha-D-glucosyltransferase, partial [Planctomycetaceae bacterium]|nr:maltose alpha-D-glucosyltransferase [Planctomycetaceae bacterium]
MRERADITTVGETLAMLLNEPLWYKDAVIYEVHVRAYCDEIGDGYGDFIGLTRKLDFLQDLGVTAIWLLPFYPSPLRDDGYDIANYTDIHPQYGKLDDFREFLAQAHDRGLRVITELVINHTSEQHPWFQRARRAPPGSSERDFYVWSDTPEKYRDARVIFKDFETSNWTYDPIARAYYWHRFYSHQPDLNFDNPAVWQALLPVVDFWFEMGVDGMRLDAVPYLFEREGTNCENLPETHEYLKALRRHVDGRFSNRMLLAEANQWPEDAVAYFGNGDECHMAFHFPVMPRLFMAMHMEDRFPVVDILNQTPAIPDNCQWAMFLRYHDELTLEMVTDEERDYMYRAYAHDRQARVNLGIRRRLAPLLGNNRRRIELMNGLLFSLPGTPVIYYGDEIGMGDNIYLGDRNGVRTPMQWSADRNAGFSRANPQRLYLPINIDPEYHYEAINVEAQQNNPSSLLWWMKRLIGQRRLHKALGRGSIEFLHPQNRRILAFVRQFEDEHILVVANLSRFVQHVELDLSKYAGVVPHELFGGTPFPRVGSQPYLLTFGPHSFYWILLQPQTEAEASGAASPSARCVAEIREEEAWEHLFTRSGARRLETALRQHLEQSASREHRRPPRAVRLRESFRVPYADTAAYLAIVDVEYAEWTPETLAIPIAFATSAEVAGWAPGAEPPVIARIEGPHAGVLLSAY